MDFHFENNPDQYLETVLKTENIVDKNIRIEYQSMPKELVTVWDLMKFVYEDLHSWYYYTETVCRLRQYCVNYNDAHSKSLLDPVYSKLMIVLGSFTKDYVNQYIGCEFDEVQIHPECRKCFKTTILPKVWHNNFARTYKFLMRERKRATENREHPVVPSVEDVQMSPNTMICVTEHMAPVKWMYKKVLPRSNTRAVPQTYKAPCPHEVPTPPPTLRPDVPRATVPDRWDHISTTWNASMMDSPENSNSSIGSTASSEQTDGSTRAASNSTDGYTSYQNPGDSSSTWPHVVYPGPLGLFDPKSDNMFDATIQDFWNDIIIESIVVPDFVKFPDKYPRRPPTL